MLYFFLKMKHWQLFLLFILLPVLLQAWINNDPSAHSIMKPSFNALLALLGIAYLWTLGGYFYPRLPVAVHNLNLTLFRAGLLYALVDLVLLGFFADQLIVDHPRSPFYIIPFHMLATMAVFYGFYFVAKSVSTIEAGREANLNDFAGPFFMLWFFPIGVWFLQPRINRLAEEV